LAYDAILCPHGSLFLRGPIGISRLLAKIERLVAEDGCVAFKAEIARGAEPHPAFLDTGLVSDGGLAAQLELSTGFVAEGGFDAGPSLAAAQPEGGASPGWKPLLWRDRERVVIPSLWFLRKRGKTPAGGWEGIEQWLVSRLLGEQMQRMQLGAAGRWDEQGRIATVSGRKGHVFFGPYLALPEGHYEALIAIEAPVRGRGSRLEIEVVANKHRLACESVRPEPDGGAIVRLRFRVPPAHRPEDLGRVEIRARSSGVSAAFTEIRLGRVGSP
jgi:hypothetical protein